MNTLSDDQILAAFRSIRCWSRSDQRAPHKPLLLLLALAQLQRKSGRSLSYCNVEPRLRQLLLEFGPRRKTQHPEHPFWRLQNDGIWIVDSRDSIRQELTSSGDATADSLRRHQANGQLTNPIHAALVERPELVNRIVTDLLDRNFPPSMHETLLDAVDFQWIYEKRRYEKRTYEKRMRDPHFREEIIRIYEHRCAVCGFDGRLGLADIGLEAAHIKWLAAGGPDASDNGIALCVLHHVLFDRGALSIDEELRLLVSKDLHGQNHVETLILAYSGLPIRKPQPGEPEPDTRYTAWHRREVFRGPSRAITL
ncbi:MAG: HNH endonuclease [candidate division Zixibacteria bacterium]|nr:HNH endonuclease [candidate division Zixibacteria bacterium]